VIALTDDGNAIDAYIALLRAVSAANNAEQRGLSRTVGTDQPANPAAPHLSIDAVENFEATRRMRTRPFRRSSS